MFLLAVALAQRVPHREAPPKGYSLTMRPRPAPPARIAQYAFKRISGTGWVLPLMLLAGAVAFFQEVLWTRMLAHVVGSSIYAFGVMVASFLTGIALGGGIGAALARTRERAALALGAGADRGRGRRRRRLSTSRIAAAEHAGLLRTSDIHFGFLHVPNTLFCGLLLLPMTLAIGMTYPLAVRVLASDADDAAPASARVYAWNTVGAIAGSLAAGFVLIPALKYEGAIHVAVCASAALGIAALWVLVPVNRIYAIGASVVAIAVCVFFGRRRR